LLATGGAIALLVIGPQLDTGPRRVVLGAAGAVIALLATAVFIAVWIESHGMRCIGPCG